MVGADSGILRDTVQRLAGMEYRGYDSYGIAGLHGDESAISVHKNVGSVGRALRAGEFDSLPDTTLALAHTRWATHGGVTQANAHPHLDALGTVAVVHNGVIANHHEIRRQLEHEGVVFASDTDSEVAAHLIGRHIAAGATVLDALARTTRTLTGEYALGVIALSDPDAVYGTKRKSPLVAGHDGTRAALASDQMALTGLGQVVFLDDGDLVRLTPTSTEIYTLDADGQPVAARRPQVTLADQQTAEKGTFPHWMIKEIHDIPAAISTALHLPADQFDGIIPTGAARPAHLIGAGSAFYAAHIGQYLLAELAGISAIALPSDEASYLALLRPGDAVIAISQSGETFDTLEICRAALATGAVLTSVCNVPNSTQERMATHQLRQGSGPEICVLSTKSTISQVVLLARLALETGQHHGTLNSDQYQEHVDALTRLPEVIRGFLTDEADRIQEIAKQYSHVEDWFFIGRGHLFPAACESALKFKEVSYRHAEGMPAGLFKHGTISLIDEDFYTVALLPSAHAAEEQYTATLVAVSEIAARGGPVIGLGSQDADPDDIAAFSDYLALPYLDNIVTDLIIQLVAGQLLAYYCALHLGREIDQPRSLAKSVTVR
ncbi:glutamine--fructose-6-phosphate transaminase (isomerizing) [Frankia sp. AiPa1]|nr:glutamine--fructose-6-phosphate transaminase (isomerizing) [Frankia sp. AiPa1]